MKVIKIKSKMCREVMFAEDALHHNMIVKREYLANN